MEGIFPSPAEAETEEEMFTMPTIDMVATGRNIMRLREVAGLTVRDLQDIFDLRLLRPSTSGSMERPCLQSIIWLYWQQCWMFRWMRLS